MVPTADVAEHWADGEPNNEAARGGPEHCVEVSGNCPKTHYMNDVRCQTGYIYPVCQKRTPRPPGGCLGSIHT